MELSKNKIRKLRRRERKKQHRINAQLKKRLYRDKVFFPCCYCNSVFLLSTLTIEHITPLSLGGGNQESNISLACAPCNHEKGRQVWFDKREQDRLRYEPIKEYYNQLRINNET